MRIKCRCERGKQVVPKLDTALPSKRQEVPEKTNVRTCSNHGEDDCLSTRLYLSPSSPSRKTEPSIRIPANCASLGVYVLVGVWFTRAEPTQFLDTSIRCSWRAWPGTTQGAQYALRDFCARLLSTAAVSADKSLVSPLCYRYRLEFSLLSTRMRPPQ